MRSFWVRRIAMSTRRSAGSRGRCTSSCSARRSKVSLGMSFEPPPIEAGGLGLGAALIADRGAADEVDQILLVERDPENAPRPRIDPQLFLPALPHPRSCWEESWRCLPSPEKEPKMATESTGTRDETYNLVSVPYHALQGAETYHQYVQDAEQRGESRKAWARLGNARAAAAS
jgi:hypothetical protein